MFTHLCNNLPLPSGFNQSLVDLVIDAVQNATLVQNSFNNSRYGRATGAQLLQESFTAMSNVRAVACVAGWCLWACDCRALSCVCVCV